MQKLELEKALYQRCEADSQYATLFAQWTFDKQIVGRALQSIPLVFPHYSLHDASHADTIVRQMARLLGPRRIERLSPTDLWLLLEAAYHHDLGMVVAEETMQAWWADKKFIGFLQELEGHTDEDIRHAAALLGRGQEFASQAVNWPFDVRRALVLVMAEYARPRHAGQSRQYVDAPSLIDLQSPRTTLVPRRFWRLLGRICESHGLGFRAMLKLPQRESGFGVDEAHPRFIASMLRLGDLLDLDDGRFCPVMARAFGGLPPSSKAHKEKHGSIEEFFVDSSEVRVVAECRNADAFDVTERWLSWLRDELRDQSVHWSELSPMLDFGAVPSAGKIEARLLDYHTFEDGRRPRFDIDRGAMFELVQGAGLYTKETACIAELLQNSVDATLLRLWADDPAKWLEIHRRHADQAIEELRKELQHYRIDVQVRKHQGDTDQNQWEVVIEDNGAGINKADVEFLQCVGSSRKNPRRANRLREMPEWMKPAGYFGIGLQSPFLFTDRLVIRSRADDSLETIEIELTKRPGGKPSDERQILVRTLPKEEAFSKPKTRINFILAAPRVPRAISWNSRERESAELLKDYDPLVDNELPFLAAQVRDATRQFARHSLAQLRLDGNILESATNRLNRFFDSDTCIEIALKATAHPNCDFYYRGREADFRHYWEFFDLQVSSHKSNASEVLTVNREKVRETATKVLRSDIQTALTKMLPRYYAAIKDDNTRVEELKYLALAVEVKPDFRQISEEGRLPLLDHWRQIEYAHSGITLGEIVEAKQIRIVEDPQWEEKKFRAKAVKFDSDTHERITVTGKNFEDDFLWDLLRHRHVALKDYTLIKPDHAIKEEWLVLCENSEDNILTNDVFKAVLQHAMSRRLGTPRRTIPCRKRFLAMAFSAESETAIGYHRRVFERLNPRALSPFRVAGDEKISLDGVEALVKWTYEHRLQQATTELEIARAVIDLVEVADSMLRDEIRDRIDYSVDDLRRKLVKIYGKDVLPAPEPVSTQVNF